jgi:hypothetical protein
LLSYFKGVWKEYMEDTAVIGKFEVFRVAQFELERTQTIIDTIPRWISENLRPNDQIVVGIRPILKKWSEVVALAVPTSAIADLLQWVNENEVWFTGPHYNLPPLVGEFVLIALDNDCDVQSMRVDESSPEAVQATIAAMVRSLAARAA